MYIYAQKKDGHVGQYEMFLDTNLPEIVSTHKHIAVYQQSVQHVDGLDYSKVKLRGDFVIDLDDGDISASISNFNKVLDLLQADGLILEYVKLYASGKKGFHIIVPQKVMEPNPKATTLLNKYHGWMAAEMSERCGVPFDMNLYHTRHLIRTPNLQRDIGTWKVPLSVAEARSITPETYKQYCSAPRHLDVTQMVPNTYVCEKLGALFTTAKSAVKEQLVLQAKFPSIAVDALDHFVDKHPACISSLLDQKAVKPSAGWNLQAMNMASYLAGARRLTPAARDSALQAFIDVCHSDSRSNAALKRRDIMTKLKAAAAGALSFSCGACRSVLSENPCRGCPVSEAKAEEVTEFTSIEARGDGYYVLGAKGEGTRITTFTLTKIARVVSNIDGDEVYHADIFSVSQRTAGVETVTQVVIPSESWTSVGAFKKTMATVANCVVTIAQEAILSALQIYLNETQLVELQVKTDKAGIHIVSKDDGEEACWVEPGWSVLPSGLTGDFTYVGNAGHTIQSIRGIPAVTRSDKQALDIFKRLLRSNRPELVGQMLGWAAACHLKEHLNTAGYSEFPLLHIAGKPSSGKTQSAIVYGGLTGALADGPLVVDSATPSPLRQALSHTTTIARVFDEFNRVNMQQGRYLAVLGFLKAAYCRQNVAQGILTERKLGESTAGILNRFATAPIIYMSREATESEELRARSLIMQVTSDDHKTDNHEANFQAVRKSMADKGLDGSPIQRWCKLLVRDALLLDIGTVANWYLEAKDNLGMIAHARKINNYTVVMTGFRLLRHSLQGVSEELLEELDKIIVKTRTHWTEEDAEDTKKIRDWSTSEVLMKTLETMAKIAKDDRAIGRILPDIHYYKTGNSLHINPYLVFGPYRAYCNAAQILPEVQSPDSMSYMLKNTNYYVTHGGTASEPQTKDWITLDLGMLEVKGIYGESFQGE